jgi:hypothetical protein
VRVLTAMAKSNVFQKLGGFFFKFFFIFPVLLFLELLLEIISFQEL